MPWAAVHTIRWVLLPVVQEGRDRLSSSTSFLQHNAYRPASSWTMGQDMEVLKGGRAVTIF